MKKIAILLVLLSIFSFPVYAANNKESIEPKTDYIVEDINYDKYIMLKSELLNISTEEAQKDLTDSENTVYRKYTKTFSYNKFNNFKVDLVCLFTLVGEENYFQIKDVIVGSKKSSDDINIDWNQTLIQIREISSYDSTVYATGKLTIFPNRNMTLKPILYLSFPDILQYTLEPLDMVSNITIEQLKYY